MTNITSMTTTKETMKAGKITAKLRDAVQVSFMVGEDERIRYKNIEIPEALKELPITRFGFHLLMDGKIEFQLHFAEGVLPKEFPEKRARQHRKPKGDAPAEQPTTAIVPAKPAQDAPKPLVADAAPASAIKAPVKAEDAKKADAMPTKPATAIAQAKPAQDAPKPLVAAKPAAQPKDTKGAAKGAKKPDAKGSKAASK